MSDSTATNDLPPEILENIFTHAYHTEGRLSCLTVLARVRKSWLGPARQQLYNDVSVRNPIDAQKILPVLKDSNIVGFVRKVKIAEHSCFIEGALSLAGFESLRSLELQTISFDSRHAVDCLATFIQLPNLAEFLLVKCKLYSSLRDVFSGSSPQLKSLSLIHTTIEAPTSLVLPLPPSPTHPTPPLPKPFLSTLVLAQGSVPYFLQYLNQNHSGLGIEQVHELKLHVESVTGSFPLGAFLTNIGSSLQKLEISISALTEACDAPTENTPVDLSSATLPVLKHFTLYELYPTVDSTLTASRYIKMLDIHSRVEKITLATGRAMFNDFPRGVDDDALNVWAWISAMRSVDIALCQCAAPLREVEVLLTWRRGTVSEVRQKLKLLWTDELLYQIKDECRLSVGVLEGGLWGG